MRVLYVSATFPALSEAFVVAEAEQVARSGTAVFVAGWHRPAAIAGPVPVGVGHRVGGAPGPAALVRCLAAARRVGGASGAAELTGGAVRAAMLLPIARQVQPDVVHAHFASMPTYVATILGKVIDRPVTATFHARDYRVRISAELLRTRIENCARVFVISEQARADIVERCGTALGARMQVVRASWRDTEPAVSAPARDGGPLRVLTVARLVEKKGVDTAVRATARLVHAGRQVEHVVVGAGPEASRLADLVDHLGVSASVRLVGARSQEEVARELRRADVALLLCRPAKDGDLDGIPVVLMEAANHGVPVVSTAVGGIPELVDDGMSGFLVPPGDVEAAADRLAELADDRALRHRMGQHSRDRVRRDFSPARQAERLVRAWRQVTVA